MQVGTLSASDLGRLWDGPEVACAHIRITRIKSTIGTRPARRKTVEIGLGLRKTNASRLMWVDRESGRVLQGMLRKAEGLVVAELVSTRSRPLTALHDAKKSGKAGGSPMTRTSYTVASDRPALLFSDGAPTAKRTEYLAVEAHPGFFSLAWSSDARVEDAVSDFLDHTGGEEPEQAGPPPVVVVGQGTSTETTTLADALAIVRGGDSQLSLLRVELSRCTFVWSQSSGAPFAEVGVMSREPAEALTLGMLKRTGSPSVKEQAEDLLRQTSDVITAALKTA